MSRVRRWVAATVLSGSLAAGAGVAGPALMASPAGAQPVFQQGLVNVNVTGVNIQVPIAIAANICDVNVAVLVSDLVDDSADCVADADSQAEITTGNGGGPVNQRGLVNLNITDVNAQVPIGVAANICDVNVAVLVNTFLDSASDCNSDVNTTALVTS